MPRNGSGTYTLPAGNPVVAGTTIEASWANTTLNDVATEMTGSLSRAGSGGMTGPLRLDAGTAAVPALAWSTETTTGLYRAGTNDVRLAVATSDVMRWQAAGVSVTGTLGVSAAVTLSTTLAVTGAATLSSTLAVTGTTTLTGAATLTANPTLSAGTANGVLYLDGSKVASSGSALTFDGTNLGVGTASPGVRLDVSGADGVRARVVATSAGTSGLLLSSAGVTAYALKAGNGDGSFRIDQDGTDRLTLASGGNLGLGVTPSAWESTCRMLQLGAIGTVGRANSGQTQLGFNYFINSSGQYVYIQSLHATHHEQVSGEHRWFNAASGTAGNTITFTQAMTLDASGNLGIGTTSPTFKLTVSGSAPDIVALHNGVNGSRAAITASNTAAYISTNYSGTGIPLIFTAAGIGSAGTEQMRLDGSGNLGLNTATFGTSAVGVLSLGTGTAPTTGPADTVQLFSVDRSAGNTIPAVRCEGSGVTNAGITSTTVTHKIAMQVNGTIYYLLATTNAT
jgi:hypothetical protein